MSSGGPAVLVWSWIGASIGNVIVACSLGEICSTYPSAGSVYYWAGQLASEEWAALTSYITGWFNFIGNAAADAFMGYSFAIFVSALYNIMYGSQLSTLTHVIIAIITCFLWALQNIMRIDQQGWLNNFATIWTIFTTFSVVGTLFWSCKQSGLVSSAEQVFFTYYNGTGFESFEYVILIGMLTSLYSFTGYEAAGHMAEETVGASQTAPLAILR